MEDEELAKRYARYGIALRISSMTSRGSNLTLPSRSCHSRCCMPGFEVHANCPIAPIRALIDRTARSRICRHISDFEPDGKRHKVSLEVIYPDKKVIYLLECSALDPHTKTHLSPFRLADFPFWHNSHISRPSERLLDRHLGASRPLGCVRCHLVKPFV